MKKILFLFLIVYVLSISVVFSAEPPYVEYNQYDEKNEKRLLSVEVPDGAYFNIKVYTCKDHFKVTKTPIKAETAPQGKLTVADTTFDPDAYIIQETTKLHDNICVVDKDPIIQDATNDPAYGGYNVAIKREDPEKQTQPIWAATIGSDLDNIKLGVSGLDFNKPKSEYKVNHDVSKFKKTVADILDKFKSDHALRELKDSEFDVSMKKSGWQLEFAGAFTTSLLTSPKYGVDVKGNIAEQKNNEDSLKLGLAALIHMTNNKIFGSETLGSYWAPLTFGIGINDSSKVNYYIGTSLRLGGKAYFTVGANIGPVDTLPNGVSVGDKATNTNVLNNLGSRTSGNFFFALSYSFISTGDVFQKPFTPLPPK